MLFISFGYINFGVCFRWKAVMSELFSEWCEVEHVELRYSDFRPLVGGCVVGGGVLLAMALAWDEGYLVAWSVLGVFTAALVLLGTRYCTMERKINCCLDKLEALERQTKDLVGSEAPVCGGDQCFQPIGYRLEGSLALATLFKRGYAGYEPQTKTRYSVYMQREQFQKDCRKTKVYYSRRFCSSKEEAYLMVAQRHLVNVKGRALGNQEAVKTLLGVEAACSYIHEGAGAKRKKPCLVGVFTHTPVFPVFCKNLSWLCSCTERYVGEGAWYGSKGRRVDLFSVPGPALDSATQPYYDYFVSAEGKLYGERYGKYMRELFKMALCAFFDESEATEFILPEVGLGSFLGAIEPAEKQVAVDQFYSSLETVLKSYRTDMWEKKAQARGVAQIWFTSIFLSEKGAEFRGTQLKKIRAVLEDSPVINHVKTQVVMQDIREYLDGPHIMREHPLQQGQSLLEYVASCKVGPPTCPFVVNPCDPAARIGNHNDPSRSFDGAIGVCTPASLVASPSHNRRMVETARYVAV